MHNLDEEYLMLFNVIRAIIYHPYEAKFRVIRPFFWEILQILKPA